MSPCEVVTNFTAFGAPPTFSVFGIAVKSSSLSLAGSNSAFAGIGGERGGMNDNDEGEDPCSHSHHTESIC